MYEDLVDEGGARKAWTKGEGTLEGEEEGHLCGSCGVEQKVCVMVWRLVLEQLKVCIVVYTF